MFGLSLCVSLAAAFPFDVQKALILIESLWSSDQVEIVFAEPDNIRLERLFPPTMPDILGWKAQRAIAANEDIVYTYNGRVYNRLSLSIALNREPGFFLDKIITGCAMLVVMCILLFLLTAEEADRVMGAMAVFAGLVAYLFVASQCQWHFFAPRSAPLVRPPAAHCSPSSTRGTRAPHSLWLERPAVSAVAARSGMHALLTVELFCSSLSLPTVRAWLQTRPWFPTRPRWTSS